MHRRNTIRYWKFFILPLLFNILTSQATFGDTAATDNASDGLPLWEMGVTVAAAQLPHYIGSDEYERYIVPLPYVIYRGDILQADREGVRGIFYKGEKFETNLSVWGNPPVPDNNKAREGMPALDAVGEIGPALRYYIFRQDWRDHLYLQGAWRTVFSVDLGSGVDIEYQGWRSSIDLKYQNKSLLKDQDISLFFKYGLHFSDSSYHRYFYGVPNRYATPQRPAYTAGGGYSGFSLSGSIFKELTPKISMGFYARWDNLTGAEIEESPLVREENTYAVGCIAVWELTRSSKKAR